MLEFVLARRQAVAAALAVALALALAGRVLLHAGAPQQARVMAPPAAVPVTTAPSTRFIVHVVGAVRRPGLYRLEEGARVQDAVSRAGGPSRKADLALINLAAPLADGQQIVVPRRGAAGAAAAGGAAGAGTPGAAGPVHLNSATLEQLDALPGVGPVTAQKILAYRQEHGPFTSVDELDAVSGIGPARLDTLRDLVAP